MDDDLDAALEAEFAGVWNDEEDGNSVESASNYQSGGSEESIDAALEREMAGDNDNDAQW